MTPALVDVQRADVYKAGQLAATLTRSPDGVSFSYTRDWVANAGRAVATTLPVTTTPVLAAGGAVPPYFAGLLPEGRRLSALRRSVKTSADDELSLLLAIGSDPVGDVQVVPEGLAPDRATARVTVSSFAETDFADLLDSFDIEVDRAGLAGVQDKASLAMLSLPVARRDESFILKLNPPEFGHLVENEHFFVARAARSRVRTVRAELVHDRDGASGLVVTRFDRVSGTALAVEDGCQVLGLHPEAKYRVGTEALVRALSQHCAAPAPAALEFLRQLVFAYLSGNGDAHAKNFSILGDGAGRWSPAPAYDLPSSLPYGDTTLALPIDGRRDGNLTGARFVALGLAVGLPERAARRAVTETADAADGWLDELPQLPFDAGVITKMRRTMRHRQRLLRG